MRLSEKTIELTFCHQFGRLASSGLIWFGLTQKQESIAGFDACTKMRGRLLIFQFKASCHTLRILNQLETQISATDRQIDRLVYQLYNLTTAEIAIVEGGMG